MKITTYIANDRINEIIEQKFKGNKLVCADMEVQLCRDFINAISDGEYDDIDELYQVARVIATTRLIRYDV